MAMKRDCWREPAATVATYLCCIISNVFHFSDKSKNTSSKSLNFPLVSVNVTPTERSASSISLKLAVSPSTSTIPVGSFLISVNLAMIVFIAVPKFSADSRVVSIIWARNAAVVSNSIFAEAAIEAVLVIAVAISSVSEAVIAANSEYTSLILWALVAFNSILNPRSAAVIKSVVWA